METGIEQLNRLFPHDRTGYVALVEGMFDSGLETLLAHLVYQNLNHTKIFYFAPGEGDDVVRRTLSRHLYVTQGRMIPPEECTQQYNAELFDEMSAMLQSVWFLELPASAAHIDMQRWFIERHTKDWAGEVILLFENIQSDSMIATIASKFKSEYTIVCTRTLQWFETSRRFCIGHPLSTVDIYLHMLRKTNNIAELRVLKHRFMAKYPAYVTNRYDICLLPADIMSRKDVVAQIVNQLETSPNIIEEVYQQLFGTRIVSVSKYEFIVPHTGGLCKAQDKKE